MTAFGFPLLVDSELFHIPPTDAEGPFPLKRKMKRRAAQIMTQVGNIRARTSCEGMEVVKRIEVRSETQYKYQGVQADFRDGQSEHCTSAVSVTLD